jgi:hypothetical protein
MVTEVSLLLKEHLLNSFSGLHLQRDVEFMVVWVAMFREGHCEIRNWQRDATPSWSISQEVYSAPTP